MVIRNDKNTFKILTAADQGGWKCTVVYYDKVIGATTSETAAHAIARLFGKETVVLNIKPW